MCCCCSDSFCLSSSLSSLCWGKLCVCVCVCVCVRVCCVCMCCMCARVHMCISARVRPLRDEEEEKKREGKKKRGQVSIPWCNCSLAPPSLPSFFSELVASGNALIMRSDGHPIIFTSRTSKQQRARRVGTDSSQSVRGWISNQTRWPPRKHKKVGTDSSGHTASDWNWSGVRSFSVQLAVIYLVGRWVRTSRSLTRRIQTENFIVKVIKWSNLQTDN